MKIFIILVVLLGVLLAFGSALPFFSNNIKPVLPAQIFDGNPAPAEFGAPNPYVSSSASDYDSTPSDGGGDTNPTAPTLPPGGDPTQPPKRPPNPISGIPPGRLTAGILLGLAVVVGIGVGIAVYIIKKKA